MLKRALFSLFVTLVILASPVQSATYYVSTSGSDGNPGTFGQPFKTIQKGVDMISQPSDTVYVMPGEYRSVSQYQYDAVHIENKTGLPSQEIAIKAYDQNNKPVVVNRGAGFRFVNCSYVILEGFEVKDYIHGGIGIYISENVIVRNNYIHLQFQGLCQPGEGLPLCMANGTGVGQVKGRIDNFGNYILEHDGSQNTGIFLCKSQNNTIAGNRIENVDEGIYVGGAYNITPDSCWTKYTPRLWTSGNIIENNSILQAMNEGIELKSDAIRTVVRGNVLKNSAGLEIGGIEIRSAYNDVYENVIFGDNQYSKTGIRLLEESGCTNPPNDEFGNSMLIYPETGGYRCGFGSRVHHNYIYYTQGSYYVPSMNNHLYTAGNIINHNTIVGGNDFGLISDAVNSSITNNLIIGDRGARLSLLTQVASIKPAVSDYNAYYPNKKSSNGGCIVSIAGEIMNCTNGNNTKYEANSVFMASNPVGTFQPATSPIKIDVECSPSSLSLLDLEALRDTIKDCSKPLDNSYGNQIANKASDGTNIGAWQGASNDEEISRIWAIDDSEKIMKQDLNNTLASDINNQVWDGQKVKIFGAKNEIVAFQLILQSGSAGANNVDVSLPSLSSGRYSIDNSQAQSLSDPYNYVGKRIELFTEHYLNVDVRTGKCFVGAWGYSGPQPPQQNNSEYYGWVPDALIPFQAPPGKGGAPFSIDPNSNQGIWVDIYIPKDAPPGIYNGEIKVTIDSATFSTIPISLEVYDLSLPDETHIKNYFWFGGYEANFVDRFGVTYRSAAYFPIEGNYMKLFHRHRMNLLTNVDYSQMTTGIIPYKKYLVDGQDSWFNKVNGYEGPGEGRQSNVYIGKVQLMEGRFPYSIGSELLQALRKQCRPSGWHLQYYSLVEKPSCLLE